MSFDQPLLIVRQQPGLERQAEFLDRAKRLYPQELFLERAYEPFRHPVAFGGPDEGWTGRDPQEPELGLEIRTHILTPLIMPHLQSLRAASGEGPELSAHPLPDRLQRLKPRGRGRCMDADALERAVIDGHEHRHRALLQRHRARGIGAPHLIGPIGNDGPVVDLRPQDPLGVKGHPDLPSSGHRTFPTRVRLSPPFPPVAPVLL